MPVVETGFRPAIGTAYDALWTRDHGYVVWHDPTRLTSATLRQFVAHRLAHRSTVAADGYADFIADRITSTGTVYYKNAGASERPFMDGIHFTVLVQWADWKLTGTTDAFVTNRAAIDACLAAVPRSANGCVYSDPALPSVDYGFTDTVLKTGDVAYGTALQAWAYKMCAQMNGETTTGPYTTLYNAAVAGLATLRTAAGWYKGSSDNNSAVDDVWATALAVAENLITSPTDRLASAATIRDAYLAGKITQRGWVKHLPTPQTWAGTSTAVGTYQNGAYWLTPLWDCYRAVSLIDKPTADGWRDLAMREVRRQLDAEGTVGPQTAPYEWFNGATISTPKGYTASAAILNRFL